MRLMKDYIKMNEEDLSKELISLIVKYNELRGTHLFIYASEMVRGDIPDSSITMEDYYTIYDLLNGSKFEKLDFYIETPGGSGEATEEIGEFLRTRAKHIAFVVAGEAKSAGTILVLSGNEILMTETGSMGRLMHKY